MIIKQIVTYLVTGIVAFGVGAYFGLIGVGILVIGLLLFIGIQDYRE